jgi:catechol 2,3-dioxygenase-like lactoylglutathione lyase family enzyme
MDNLHCVTLLFSPAFLATTQVYWWNQRVDSVTQTARRSILEYSINHVHIRSLDPKASAAWYEKYFNAKILWEREIMPGTVTISMEVGGPVRLNISSKPAGSSDERSVAELNRLGLEHFGFHVADLKSDLKRLEEADVRVVLPLTQVPTGAYLAYIEGPDDVLIELVQAA